MQGDLKSTPYATHRGLQGLTAPILRSPSPLPPPPSKKKSPSCKVCIIESLHHFADTICSYQPRTKINSLYIYKKTRGSLTATLSHISLILVQKDPLQILPCWCSLVAWLVLVSHVIMKGNFDQ